MSPRRTATKRPADVKAAEDDLRAARTAYLKHREEIASRTTATWESLGFPPLKARRQRYSFVLARRAYYAGARLDNEEHADLVAEYEKRRSTEAIPAEVSLYLSQKTPRNRPRRLTTHARERRGLHIFWLLWGYYRRKKLPDAKGQAAATTAILIGCQPESILAWKKQHKVRWW